MSLLSMSLRRGAALILLLGAAGNRGAHAFTSSSFSGAVGQRGYARAVASIPVLRASSSPFEFEATDRARVPAAGHVSKRSLAKRAVRGLASRALTTLPSAVIAGACAGAAFPQSALAFTNAEYLSSAMSVRNLAVSGGVAAAAAASILRSRGAPRGGVATMASSASAASTEGGSSDAMEGEKKKKIPLVVLSGFLGAGKTTALKRLLENTDGIKVGTIVNDVASVNIDAKLISNPMNGGDGSPNKSAAVGRGASGTVELQNGCACCSLSDELLTSVSDLMEGRDLDAIVVELSGVADPAAVRQNWAQAINAKHPATLAAELGRVVTVVDSHTFGTDYMTWDTAGTRKWAEEGDKCAEARQVPELLAEQVEAADVIILNKIDLSEGEQLDTAKVVVRSLNEDAELIETSFGELTPIKILGDIAKLEEEAKEDGHGHEHSHDHGGSCSDPECTDASHSHSHDHESSCADPECTDTSHSHSHDHASSCSDPDCSDASHSHSHDHSSEACSDPGCTDASHSHSHSHDHSSESCSDPGCTDTSHSHSHDHKATTTDSLGISNFVYKSSRPFDPRKLQKVLLSWPIPVMEELKLVELSKELEKAEEGGPDEKSPFVGVLRSKGFAWVAPSIMSGPFNDLDRHDTAFYWSHAGKHFGLKEAGSWWASMGKEAMKNVFEGNMDEYDRIIKEDFVSGEWGDRRQEIVFIGANLDEKAITSALDSCLCDDEQIGAYKQGILDAIAEFYAEQ